MDIEPECGDRAADDVSKKPLVIFGFPWDRPSKICPHSADFVVVTPLGISYFTKKAVESGKLLQSAIGKSFVTLQRESTMVRITFPNTSESPRIIEWIRGGGPS